MKFFRGLISTALFTGAIASSASESSLASPEMLIRDPMALEKHEASGSSILNAFNAHALASTDNASLYKASADYRMIVDHIASELDALKKSDRKLSVTMSGSHRLFNIAWLKSPYAKFELAGIVNRLDRMPFAPEHCGEMRLIYRLKYRLKSKGEYISSRLPFSMNVVFWQAKGGGSCRSTAEIAYSSKLIKPENRKAVEINFQSVRWPSTIRPDLSNHAEYILRVFAKNESGRFTLSKLENTPDLLRINSSPQVKKKLLKWILSSENLRHIDAGIVVVPDEFLADRATSVSPRGFSRAANRPWSALFSEADFKSVKFSDLKYAKSPAALLRRLDDLTCIGCHQARSVAGFHLIGVDRQDTEAVNFVHVSGSPHLLSDLERRAAFRKSVATGKEPNDFRPLSERSLSDDGGYGSHCGLGDVGFAEWKCGSGMECRAVSLERGDNTVGTCLPVQRGDVGDPCETGTMVPNLNPHKDRLRDLKMSECRQQGVCYVNYGGFSDGMCGIACETNNLNSTCGAIAILKDFNSCLAGGNLFTKCVRESVDPLGMRSCDDTKPCRDDYLCVRNDKNMGSCIPPYFLFQMRVDGHPSPT